MILRNALSVLFIIPELQLENLEIGNESDQGAATPLQFLKGIRLESPALACLNTFKVTKTCGDTYFLPSSLSGPQKTTQTLAEFLTLLANPYKFDFQGGRLGYPNVSRVAAGPPSLPSLSESRLPISSCL